ncbi:hypothetical protein [Syntrophaceticus schinkii]|jgi:hypothetical protein|uniref:Uncharacterized protein n=1 Tax=Syntrophaceticus schinkii TaxID=499207 RepID=A0A0B7MKM9_9FIRM|nr:hypothetical protein [Syntrophaceticus schinkii]CEO88536.1 hypothetical protein SSCH_2020002 [Syntrophaceticus schinkii]
MTDGFPVALKLVRTDFKEITNTNTNYSVEKIIRIINKHKLGTYVYSLGKGDIPLKLTERLGTIYEASIQLWRATMSDMHSNIPGIPYHSFTLSSIITAKDRGYYNESSQVYLPP